jgi:hypothetical protein
MTAPFVQAWGPFSARRKAAAPVAGIDIEDTECRFFAPDKYDEPVFVPPDPEPCSFEIYPGRTYPAPEPPALCDEDALPGSEFCRVHAEAAA